ncbi:MAG: DUF3575 domain-containing protein [Bacteroidota bacterium]
MRKIIALLTLLALFSTGSGMAQSRTTVVKANPLSLFIATINVQGERALNERFSGQLGLFLGQARINADEPGTDRITYASFGITPELRYHATFARQDCPEGLYFAPYLRYRRIRQSYNGQVEDPDQLTQSADIQFRRNSFGGGVLIGYEVITEAGFVLDMFIGPQYSYTASKATVTCADCNGNETFKQAGFDFTGIEIRTGLALGFAF